MSFDVPGRADKLLSELVRWNETIAGAYARPEAVHDSHFLTLDPDAVGRAPAHVTWFDSPAEPSFSVGPATSIANTPHPSRANPVGCQESR